MEKIRFLLVSLLIIFVGAGCSQRQWRAEHVTTISGFHVPECALHVSTSGKVYVSNVESKPDEYWTDDSRGYISVMGADHQVTTKRWVNSEPKQILHSPKGMAILGDYLYFTDNTRLMRCTVAGKNVEIVMSGLKTANDLCTDGKSIWMSDNDRVVIVSLSGDTREISAPDGINGLTFYKGKLFGVSWSLHEVYELDPTGKTPPIAFGLAGHFTNLDGIEVLDDGTFVVSDFMGDKVCTISPDRSSVRTLIEIPSPADIGLNRKDGLLYVPQFMTDKLSVYRIKMTR